MLIAKLYIVGMGVTIALNSNVTNKFKAKALQKNDKKRAASLRINQIKQYCMIRYKVVTSLIPYKVSVIISINKKVKAYKKIMTISNIVNISKKNVQIDIPTYRNKQNIKYIKNIGE